MALLVQELKARLKRMEQQADPKSNNGSCSVSIAGQLNGGRDQTRGDTSSSLAQLGPSSTLYALREEYATKLEKLVESNAEERSEAKGQHL